MSKIGEFEIRGMFADIHQRDIYPALIVISEGKIEKILRIHDAPPRVILPGLIDSHIHIESSMVTPGAFAGAAVRQGTTAVVSDPHEIANVMGMDGVNFMIEDGRKVPLKFNFGAPSCVPATSFESSGAILDPQSIDALLSKDDIKYLSEMMNFPGVVYDDPEVRQKLDAARKFHKPVDGHAPGLRGEMLRKYIEAGISTDHECSSLDEAQEKINLGMQILIREGSAARNLAALKSLLKTNPGQVMLCSDDLHPEMLQERHINKLVAELISDGFDWCDVIRSVTVNPVNHYSLNSGVMRPGDPADIIVVDSLVKMNVEETWIDGELVYDKGRTIFDYKPGKPVNNFKSSEILAEDIEVRNEGKKVRVIEAYDGELVTGEIVVDPVSGDHIEADPDRDMLKIVVKERYSDKPAVTGFIKGFGLKRGAFACSVAHDSHNIIAVGASDSAIVDAVNAIVGMKGGMAVADDETISSLKLDIAGIMSTRPVDEIAGEYKALSQKVKDLGCHMKAPFMTLSFMALLVIPQLKIGDMGLFDGKKFRIVDLFV